MTLTEHDDIHGLPHVVLYIINFAPIHQEAVKPTIYSGFTFW